MKLTGEKLKEGTVKQQFNKEQSTTTHNNMDESHRYTLGWKNTDTKGYMAYDFIS